MRVLMLGWEFPPFIAGGLGVACYGLTRALDRLGHQVIFVLPKPVDRSHASHVRMLAPSSLAQRLAARPDLAGSLSHEELLAAEEAGAFGATGLNTAASPFKHATFRGVPAAFSSPYPGGMSDFNTARFNAALARGATADEASREARDTDGSDTSTPNETSGTPNQQLDALLNAYANGMMGAIGGGGGGGGSGGGSAPHSSTGFIGNGGGAGVGYGNDLIGDSERYARMVVALSRREQFDVIHAHDWLTFPAGLALKAATNKPLLVHVHSTEFDRAGTNVNQRVYEIERAGMQGADRVLAVSQLTKNICVRRYSIAPERVTVVYNGLDRDNAVSTPPFPEQRIESSDQIVLFLGRITMQKGPEYFIAAAKRVLEKCNNVKFVLAGSGDMALRMIELAASMGIGHKVLFTGFLRGKDVEKVFRMADCYVMPSVSEPFGLAALEAINHNVPVILSKTSGASEVLSHVLKVDFWDIDDMANKIVAVLKYPPLGETMKQHGAFELQRLTWAGAAMKCEEVYNEVTHTLVAPTV